jgi:hypothetical protein
MKFELQTKEIDNLNLINHRRTIWMGYAKNFSLDEEYLDEKDTGKKKTYRESISSINAFPCVVFYYDTLGNERYIEVTKKVLLN